MDHRPRVVLRGDVAGRVFEVLDGTQAGIHEFDTAGDTIVIRVGERIREHDPPFPAAAMRAV